MNTKLIHPSIARLDLTEMQRNPDREFLSGAGTADLTKRLIIENDSTKTESSNAENLLLRIKAFLPEIARANQGLDKKNESSSIVEIIPKVGDDTQNEDTEKHGHVEMDISLFQLNNSEPNDELKQLKTKKKQTIEEVNDE